MHAGERRCQSLVILSQPTASRQPGKTPLDHPPSRQQHKATLGLRQFHHRQLDLLFLRCLGRFLAGVPLIDVRQVNRYEASAEIAVGKGPAPEGRRVFKAQEVLANLGPSIQRPKS